MALYGLRPPDIAKAILGALETGVNGAAERNRG